MDEILKQLLESEVLTDDTRTQLAEAVEAFKTQVAEETRTEVQAQLAEEWVNDREALITALDVRFQDMVAEEVKQLHESVAEYRDQAVEHAAALLEHKQEQAALLEAELGKLAEMADAFFEIRIESELADLHEGIEAAKRNKVGQAMFEAFGKMYAELAPAGSVQAELTEAQAQVEDLANALEVSEQQVAELKRKNVMESVLSTLEGKARDLMEVILRTTETSKLAEQFDKHLPIVIGKVTAEKEKGVLAEGASGKKIDGVVKNGDSESLIEQRLKEGKFQSLQESANRSQAGGLSDSERAAIRRAAGLPV